MSSKRGTTQHPQVPGSLETQRVGAPRAHRAARSIAAAFMSFVMAFGTVPTQAIAEAMEEATAPVATALEQDGELYAAEEESYLTPFSQNELEEPVQAEAEPEPEPNYPAFEQSIDLGDGAFLVARADEGAYPEGAVLDVQAVAPELFDWVCSLVDEARDANRDVESYRVMTVRVLGADGTELEPADGSKVRMTYVSPELLDADLDAEVFLFRAPQGVDAYVQRENVQISDTGEAMFEASELGTLAVAVTRERQPESVPEPEPVFQPAPELESEPEPEPLPEPVAQTVVTDELESVSEPETSAQQFVPTVENADDPAEAEVAPEVVAAQPETPAMPAFKKSRTVDGVRVTVQADEGTFPEGSSLSVRKVSTAVEKKVEKAVDEVRDTTREVAASYTFDIKVLDKDGNEVQPADDSHVHVIFAAEEVSESLLTTEVYHIEDVNVATPVAEALEVSESGNTAVAETDGFSTYTLIFTQGKIEYDMQNASESLESLMNAVQLGNTKLWDVKLPEGETRLTVQGPSQKTGGSAANEWKITAVNDEAITDTNPVEITLRLFERPDYRVYVTKTGNVADTAHEIKLLSVDGHDLPQKDGQYQIRISQVVEVFVAGYTESEQDGLIYKYTRNSKDDTHMFRFTADELHQGDMQGRDITDSTDASIYAGQRFLANRRGEGANKPSEYVTNLTIKVYESKSSTTPLAEETVTIHAETVDLQKDLNDAARNMHPIVLHKGDIITANEIKTKLAQAGIAHPKCLYTKVEPVLDGKKTLSKTVDANGNAVTESYTATNPGVETIAIKVTKVNCYYHSAYASPQSQTGTIDVEVYVLDNVTAEYDSAQGLLVSGLSEYSSYEIYKLKTDNQGNVLKDENGEEIAEKVKEFDASELIFKGLTNNTDYTVKSRDGEIQPWAPVTVKTGVTADNKTQLTFDGLDNNWEYQLYYSNADLTGWTMPSDGSITFTGLTNNRKYTLNGHSKTEVFDKEVTTSQTSYKIESPDSETEYCLVLAEGGSLDSAKWVQPNNAGTINISGLTKNKKYKLYKRSYISKQEEAHAGYTVTQVVDDETKQYRIKNGSNYSDWLNPTGGQVQYVVSFGGKYTLESRIPAVPPSEPNGETAVTTGGSVPPRVEGNPEIRDVTKTTVTVRAEPGKEYSIDGGSNWETASTRVFDDLPSGKYKVVEIVNGINFVSTQDSTPRVIDKDEAGTTTGPIVVSKESQETPEQPSVGSTPTTVTVDPVVVGQQYVILPKGQTPAELDWSSNRTITAEDTDAITFSGLDFDTEYTVFTRKPGDKTHDPSSAASAEIKTKEYIELTDSTKPTIAIKRGDTDVTDNTPQIGDTLTASTSASPVTYKWYVVDEDGKPAGDPLGEGATYVVTKDDKGKKIVAVAEQTMGEDGSTLNPARTATSAPTNAVTLKDNTTTPSTEDTKTETTTDSTKTPATSTITVKPTKAGYEYVVTESEEDPSETVWAATGAATYYKETATSDNETGHTFTDLEAGKQYYVHMRQAATDDTKPSSSVSVSAPTKPAAPNPASEGATIDYEKETITAKDGYEILKPGSNPEEWVDAISSADFNPGTDYRVRKKAADPIPASDSAELHVNDRPAAPQAPQVTSVAPEAGDTTVSIKISNAEKDAVYTVTDASGNPVKDEQGKPITVTATEDGELAIDGLKPNTEYKLEAQRPATANAPASKKTIVDVKTDKVPAAKPTGLEGNQASSADAKDGSITGVDTTMEYWDGVSKNDDGTEKWTSVTGDKIDNLGSGTYYVRVAETADNAASEAVPVVVSGKPQADAPTKAAELESKTATSITVQAEPGQECSIDGTTWVKADENGKVTFTELAPNTEYTIKNRTAAPEDGSKNPSDPCAETLKVTTNGTQNAPSGLGSTKTTSETAKDGSITGVSDAMEYSTDGGKTWTPVPEGKDAIDGLGAGEYQVRLKATTNPDKDPSPATTVTVGTKTTPAAPNTSGTTVTVETNSITVKPTEGGYQYIVTTSATEPTASEWLAATASADGKFYEEKTDGTNADGHTFTGLEPGTQYYVHVRKAGTPDTNVSPASTIAAPTKPAAPNPASDAVDVDCQEETITPKEGYEILKEPGADPNDPKNWVKAPDAINPFTPGATYPVRVAPKTDNEGNVLIPASDPVDFKAPEQPDAPTTPVASPVDAVPGSETVSIKVSPVDNKAVYTVKDGEGKVVKTLTPDPEKPGTFKVTNPDGSAADPATVEVTGDPASMTVDGLKPNTKYTVEAQIPATKDTPASKVAVSDSVTTKPGKLDEDTIKNNPAYQVTANDKPALEYDGTEHVLVKAPQKVPDGYNMQYGTKDSEGNITWSNELPKGTNAGDYEVFVKYVGDDDHEDLTLDEPIKVTIAPKDINKIDVTFGETEFTYKGTAQGPTVTVKDGDKDLALDTDYELTGKANATEVGDYNVKVVGKGNYTGSKDQPYTIKARELKDSDKLIVEFSTDTFTYNGSDQRPTEDMATVKIQHEDGSESTVPAGNYKLTFPEYSINADTYKVQVTLAKNYSGTGEGKYTIAQKSLKDSDVEATFAGITFIYSGSEQGPVISVKYGSIVLHENADFAVEGQQATNKGTYTAKVTGKGNYKDELTQAYTINPYKTSDTDKVIVTFPDDKDAFPYNGEVQKPAEGDIVVKLNETELNAGTDYEVAYSEPNSKDVGAYTVTITLKGNYEGTTQKGYAISSATLANITGDKLELTYTGNAQGPTNIVVTGSDSKVLVEDTDYTLSNTSATNAGTYTVVATGRGNYSGTLKLEYKIKKADPTGLTDDDKPKVTTATDDKTGKSTVTVNPSVVGQEYVVVPKGTKPEDVNWEKPNSKDGNGGELVFDGLEPGVEYEVLTRTKGDDNTNPSDPVSTLVPTKPVAPSPADSAVTVDYKKQTLTAKDEPAPGYQIFDPKADDGKGAWVTEVKPFDPDTDYQVRVAPKTDDEGNEIVPASDPATYHTPSQPETPAKPQVTAPEKAAGEDAGKLTINNPDDVIYTVKDGDGNIVQTLTPDSANPGTYKVTDKDGKPANPATVSKTEDGKLVVEGLEPNTEYTVTAQKPATETSLASDPVASDKTSTPKEQEAEPEAPKVTAQNTSVIINPADSGTIYTITGPEPDKKETKVTPNEDGTFTVTDPEGKTTKVEPDEDGKLTVDGLEPNTDYTVTATTIGKEPKVDSDPSAPTSVTTGKASQDAPEADPSAKAGTDAETGKPNVVVDPSDKDQEYLVLPVRRDADGKVVPYTDAELEEAWKHATPGDEHNGPITITKDGNGEDLNPGDEYEVLTRKKGDDTTEPSDAKSTTVVTAPNPADAVKANGKDESIKADDGYEIKDPETGSWVKEIKPFKPGETYPVRKAADDENGVPASEPANYVAPEQQPKPKKPEVVANEAEPGEDTVSITIKDVEDDVIYTVKDDEGNVVVTLTPDPDKPGTFRATDKQGNPAEPASVTKGDDGSVVVDGLEPNTAYTVDAQRPASGEKPASDVETSAPTTTSKAKLDPSKLTPDQKPTANDNPALVYNGDEQPLVKAPVSVPDGYAMKYATTPEGPWSDGLPEGIDAGDYSVYVKYVGDDAHEDVVLPDPITVAIAKKAITDPDVSLASNAFIYSGTEQGPEVTVKVDGKILSASRDYSLSGTKATDKGEHTVTVEGTGNYTGKVEKTFNINAYAAGENDTVAIAFGNGDDSFVYDGADHRPDPEKVVVRFNDTVLEQGKDYDLVYPPAGQSVDSGGYEVKVVLKGNYQGETAKDYVITPAKATDLSIDAKPVEFTYSGKPQGPAVTVKSGNKVLTEGTDYTITGETATEKGSHTLTVTGMGNYAGTATKDYTINPYAKGDNDKLDITFPNGNKDSFAYDGSDHRPAADGIKVTLNGKELKPGEDYELEYSAADGESKNAGSYEVKVVLKGNYEGESAKGYKIEPKDISDATVIDPRTFTYDGNEKTPVVTVKDGDKTLSENTDYTVVGRPATDANSYQITVRGTGNYTGTVVDTYIINKATGDATKLNDNQKATSIEPTPVYDGTEKNLVAAPTAEPPAGYTKMQYGTKDENGNIVWSDKLPTGTDAGDYPVYTKYVGDKNHDDLIVNGEDNPLVVSIEKAEQDKPATPQVSEPTDNSVEVTNPKAGVVYQLLDSDGNVVAQKTATDDDQSIVFEGLDPNKDFTVRAYVPGDDNHKDSQPATAEAHTRPAAPKSGEGYRFDYGDETVAAGDGYLIRSKPDGEWTTGPVPFDPGEEFEVKKVGDKGGLDSKPVAFSAPKRAEAPTPADPKAKDDKTIRIDPSDAAQEYVVLPAKVDDEGNPVPYTDDELEEAFKNAVPGTGTALDITKDANGAPLESGANYVVYNRTKAVEPEVDEDGNVTNEPAIASDPASTSVTTDKNAQPAPEEEPVAQPKTTSISVNPTVPGQEYIVVPKGHEPTADDWAGAKESKDGEEITFKGLIQGQDYEVLTRVPATDTQEASEPTSTEVHTPRSVSEDGEVAPYTDADGDAVDEDGNKVAKDDKGDYYPVKTDANGNVVRDNMGTAVPDTNKDKVAPMPSVMVVGVADKNDPDLIQGQPNNLEKFDKDLADEILKSAVPTYDAKKHAPESYDNAKVRDDTATTDDAKLKEGEDYTISYYDPEDIDKSTGLPKSDAKPLNTEDPDAFDYAFDAGEKVAVIEFHGDYAGTLTAPVKIAKREFHVVTPSATKTYDGTALEAPEPFVWVEGGTDADGNKLADDQGLVGTQKVDVEVTGSQTSTGTSKNTYTIRFKDEEKKDAEGSVVAQAVADVLGIRTAFADDAPDGVTAEGQEPTAKRKNYEEVAELGTLTVEAKTSDEKTDGEGSGKTIIKKPITEKGDSTGKGTPTHTEQPSSTPTPHDNTTAAAVRSDGGSSTHTGTVSSSSGSGSTGHTGGANSSRGYTLAKTGDDTNASLPLVVAVFGVVTLLVGGRSRRREASQGNER